jgi:hypothetical protein
VLHMPGTATRCLLAALLGASAMLLLHSPPARQSLLFTNNICVDWCQSGVLKWQLYLLVASSRQLHAHL